MNWISADMEKLAQHIETECVDFEFPAIDRSCLSYFEDYDMAEAAVEEFGFSTIPEMQKLLKKKRIVNSKDIDITCAVAAFKNKPEKEAEESAEEYTLPTFIYNF